MHSSQRFALPAFIIFILVLVAGLFYIKPLWEEVSALSITRDQKISEKQTLTQRLEQLQQLNSDLQSGTEVSTQTTLNAIPVRLEQDRILTDLTDIAKKNDVVLNGATFGFATNALDKIKRVSINVNLTSDESKLVGFLRDVESNERKMMVKSITVQSSRVEETSLSRINFTLLLETYYQDSF